MAAGFDIFRTSNDRQNIASYSDRSVGFALRAGWAYTEHTRQNVRYTLRQTDIYNVQPWASTIVQRNAGTSVVSEISETHRLGYARHAPQHDQGLAAAQHDGGWRA